MLAVEGLRRKGVLNDVSLTVRQGEIVGIAGLVGSGRTELARAIAGADPIDGGKISVDGKERRIRSPAHALAAGIAFLTEERKKDGLFMELSLGANTTFADVPAVSARGILRRRSGAPPDTPAARVAERRPADAGGEGQQPVGRQPAEGALRSLAVPQPEGADPR